MKTGVEKLGKDVRFERLRRITGYLTATLDRWNSAKQAEERDRVKHYVIKSEARQQQAEKRRKDIEDQLKGPYGIAYTDSG